MWTSLSIKLQEKIECEPNSGCWLWVAAWNWAGYGLINLPGYKGGAHVGIYQLLVGPVPEGLQLDHTCRTRCCVNPAHLEPVPGQVNTLRSPIAPAAVNAGKTHCPRGHLLSGDNLYRNPKGERNCRECQRAATTRWKKRTGYRQVR